MVCKYCNEVLPEDSEFCQYCGQKIEKEDAVAETMIETEVTTSDVPNINNATKENVLEAFIEMQVEQTVKTFEENRKSQPNNEDADDFGLVLEKPIYTLASKSVSGEQEYLNQLYTENGVKIKWERLGSAWAESINGPVDIYETYLPSGQQYKTIYINMYGAKESEKAPAGFILNNEQVRRKQKRAKKEKKIKNKFCSRCGSLVDGETKKCMGCGKQYFKGLKFKRTSVGFMVLSLLLIASVGANIFQIADGYQLKEEIKESDERRRYWKNTADDLEAEVADLKKDLREAKEIADFVDKNVVFVANDGTNLYHKYSCDKIRGKGLWVHFEVTAKGKGYKACSLCH